MQNVILKFSITVFKFCFHNAISFTCLSTYQWFFFFFLKLYYPITKNGLNVTFKLKLNIKRRQKCFQLSVSECRAIYSLFWICLLQYHIVCVSVSELEQMSYQQAPLLGDFLLARSPSGLPQTGVFQSSIIVESWLLPRIQMTTHQKTPENYCSSEEACPPKPPQNKIKNCNK